MVKDSCKDFQDMEPDEQAELEALLVWAAEEILHVVGQEYLGSERDAVEFEHLIDEAAHRMRRFCVTRFLEVVTRRHDWRVKEIAWLYPTCKIIDEAADQRLRPMCEDLKRAAWERQTKDEGVADAPAVRAEAGVEHCLAGGSGPIEATTASRCFESRTVTEHQDSGAPNGTPSNSLDFASENERVNALASYQKNWTCSEAALARTASVNPADLSKWKAGGLPAKSSKTARIEKALRENTPPTPAACRKPEA
jgi:hypothetical protein